MYSTVFISLRKKFHFVGLYTLKSSVSTPVSLFRLLFIETTCTRAFLSLFFHFRGFDAILDLKHIFRMFIDIESTDFLSYRFKKKKNS